MVRFEVCIIGCSAAVPLRDRHQTAQVVRADNALYLLDCGEGTQMRLAEYGLKTRNIQQIFISHLHGDHVFGLMPFLNSLSLNNRQNPMQLFGPVGLSEFIETQQRLTHSYFTYPITITELEPGQAKLIHEDGHVRISCFPLKHPVPTFGYRFDEKPPLFNLRPEAIEAYQLPREALKQIKAGADYTTTQGHTISNDKLTLPLKPLRSYAFCTDTAYDPAIVPYIKNVNVLYHEATFLDQDGQYAQHYGHSTAAQAALIASQAGAGSLLMGHISGRYADLSPFEEEARCIFARASVVHEGQVIQIHHDS